MAKKFGFDPFILLTDPVSDPANPAVTGGGSGQGGHTVGASPMSFDSWMASDWMDDYIQDGSIDMYDYAAWWDYCGFSEEDWRTYNGDTWDQYFG